MIKKNIRQKGFTLFELLISISIIGILTALATISFSAAQKKARDSRRIQDMKIIQTAAEQYYSLNSYKYPVDTIMPWTVNGQVVLENFPNDPKTNTIYPYNGGIGTSYCACATVESVNNGNSAINNCSLGIGGTAGDYYCVKSQQ